MANDDGHKRASSSHSPKRELDSTKTPSRLEERKLSGSDRVAPQEIIKEEMRDTRPIKSATKDPAAKRSHTEMVADDQSVPFRASANAGEASKTAPLKDSSEQGALPVETSKALDNGNGISRPNAASPAPNLMRKAAKRDTDSASSSSTSSSAAPAAAAASSVRDSTLPAIHSPSMTKARSSSASESDVTAPRKGNLPLASSSSVSSNQVPSSSSSFLGARDLEAVAQAAVGLDASGKPLPGNEESHRSLADAVQRLSSDKGSANGEGSALAVGEDAQQDFRDDEDGDNPQKRFQCHLCDRAFARAYNLNTHLATHDPDPNRAKPFPCPYPSCKADGGRSFSRKHDLQRHVASTHENEPEPGDEGEVDEHGNRIGGLASLGLGTPGRKFRCEECGRAFVRRDALKRHQCIPTGSPSSSTGGAPTGGASTAGRMASPSTPRSTFDTAPDSPYSGAMPSGLSLYTSTGAHPAGSGGSSVAQRYSSNGLTSTYDANAPFYPSGVTYESLTREVEDMAMQLVAQATSYNEKHDERDKVGRSPRVTAGPRR